MAKMQVRKVAPEIGEWLEAEVKPSATITDETGQAIVFLEDNEWGFDVTTGKGWICDAARARLDAAIVARKASA